ncbi:MAG: TIR domain-containing protein, partial [Gammaproteobacteria bacterium]|nr:TIR domain-containing protein [Gammaproteobacteria bacterium]
MTHDRTQQQGQTGPLVFICYAREDYAIAERLYHDLERAGAAPWLDQKKLVPGQNWKVEIRRAIEHSTYVLVVLSTNSVSKRGYVQKELKKALDLLDEFPSSTIYLIPARIEECEPIDERLQDIHWVNLFSDYKEGLRQILGVLLPDSTPRPPRRRLKMLMLIGVLSLLLIGGGLFGDDIIRMITPAPTPTAIPTATPTATPTPNPPTPTPVPTPTIAQLRSKPLTVSHDKAQQEFDLTTRNFDWGTSDWAPRPYINNQYEDRGNVVVDHATGLMWQKSGSDNYMTYLEAQQYVKKLNRQKFAGYDDWRLPTIPELMSLLEPEESSNGLYIDSIFDKTQRWCWSADRLSEGGSSSAAWYVHFD